MSRETVAGADVDVCAACGGLWVDWFDGEVRAVAVRALKDGVTGRPSAAGTVRNEARAIGACPRCTRHLVSERYVMRTLDARAGRSVRGERDTGAELLRCEDCAGVFVSRTSVEVLASLPTEVEEPPRAAPPDSTPPLPLTPLGRLVRALFGRGAR
jgi:Zn-finger nucleic acid-binding protein